MGRGGCVGVLTPSAKALGSIPTAPRPYLWVLIRDLLLSKTYQSGNSWRVSEWEFFTSFWMGFLYIYLNGNSLHVGEWELLTCIGMGILYMHRNGNSKLLVVDYWHVFEWELLCSLFTCIKIGTLYVIIIYVYWNAMSFSLRIKVSANSVVSKLSVGTREWVRAGPSGWWDATNHSLNIFFLLLKYTVFWLLLLCFEDKGMEEVKR